MKYIILSVLVYFLIKSFFPVRIQAGSGFRPTQNPDPSQKSREGDYIDYEEIKDE
ncbi:MAG: hypothetical protein IPN79_06775 [Saprospiraceae bacterium]|nr:hypothetical protein [Saprospiraceae bacterium]